MKKLIDYYQKSVFSCLQNEQVELGREDGLSEKEIALYAKPYYNFLQMNEIRLAIENGTDPRQRKALCHSRIPADEMKAMRLQLEHGELLRNPPVPPKIWSTVLLSFAAFAGLLQVCNTAVNGPYLSLNTEEAVLELGEPFNAMQYIDQYSGKDATLVLPQNIDTSCAERQTAVYHLISDGEDIMRTMTVSVIPEKEG